MVKHEHAKHNKKLCDELFLCDQVKYHDWVVTTAFYSSIHFFDHKMFPCEFNGKEIKNMSDAHYEIKADSKHQSRGILISKIMPQYKADYDFLLSESQNARYNNYNVNPVISNRAYSIIEKISNL